jgi:hypothetical protein
MLPLASPATTLQEMECSLHSRYARDLLQGGSAWSFCFLYDSVTYVMASYLKALLIFGSLAQQAGKPENLWRAKTLENARWWNVNRTRFTVAIVIAVNVRLTDRSDPHPTVPRPSGHIRRLIRNTSARKAATSHIHYSRSRSHFKRDDLRPELGNVLPDCQIINELIEGLGPW